MPISRLPMMVCVRGVFAVCLSRIYLSWCVCMWCLYGIPYTRSLRFAYLASTCLSISAALAMSRSVCKGRACGMRASKCLSQTLFLKVPIANPLSLVVSDDQGPVLCDHQSAYPKLSFLTPPRPKLSFLTPPRPTESAQVFDCWFESGAMPMAQR